jgi:hypothetical protein
MNCEQTREAIDSGIQSEAVHSHLTSCPACQQFEAETSSLLSLLSAQPRIKAPTNFETQLQARLQTALVSEEAKLTALLGALPMVAAPANFEAQLQARLASEEVKVAALVGVLPAIEAPGDFDFRLRARLAQTKAEETARGPLAWLSDFLAQSFSFGQAATAMAAVALVVAFSVTQINRETAQPSNSQTLVAKGETSQAPETHNLSATAVAAPNPAKPAPQTVAVKTIAGVGRQLMSAVSASAKPAAVPAVERQLVASNIGEQTVLSSVTRQEIKGTHSGYAFGQQLVKSSPVQKAEAPNVAF